MGALRSRCRRSARDKMSRFKLVGLTALIAFLSAAAIWVGAVSFRILVPPTNGNAHTDVVLSLAPGDNRLPTALKFYEQGDADNLAISWFPAEFTESVPEHSKSRLAQDTCTAKDDTRVYCFTPSEGTTIGEALAFRELAESQDWDSVTLVTSSYHVFRARYIFERCLPSEIEVQTVSAPIELSRDAWRYHLLYENMAYLKAIAETSSRC